MAAAWKQTVQFLTGWLYMEHQLMFWEIRDFSLGFFSPNRTPAVSCPSYTQPLPLPTFIHLYLTSQIYVLNTGIVNHSAAAWTSNMGSSWIPSCSLIKCLKYWPFRQMCFSCPPLWHCWAASSGDSRSHFMISCVCSGRVTSATSMSNPCEGESVTLSLLICFRLEKPAQVGVSPTPTQSGKSHTWNNMAPLQMPVHGLEIFHVRWLPWATQLWAFM